MANKKEIDTFLKDNQIKAFKRAVYATNNEEAALDIVQEAMIKLVENYSEKPVDELLFLFQKILSNKINDWFREKKNNCVDTLSDFNLDDADENNFLDSISSQNIEIDSLFENKSREETLKIIERGLEILPDRQKEAFLLRYLDDCSVSETANIMGCSEGSVKTHCSRASAALAKFLKSFGLG